jgi:hypothetical protein
MLYPVRIGPGSGRARRIPGRRPPVTGVWIALAIETVAALVIAGSLAAWARHHFTGPR